MSKTPGPGSDTQSEIAALARKPIRSETRSGVSYRLERAIGRGGFAIACLAERIGPDGTYPVVLKISRPAVVAQNGEMVMRVLKKEVVALGRLNERVPPTPFVVRLIDTGTLEMSDNGVLLNVPWIAIEYVHGGIEGETLSKRVRYSMDQTGFAFEPARAVRALKQLSAGIGEIHAAQVIHRDLKPSNVLSCGFGEKEILKISDFGIARPTGVASTFGKLTLGSPGYVAPEQIHLRDEIGPWTDVFSLAAVTYFVLAGEKYFDVSSPVDGVFAAMGSERKSLGSARALSPELRARPDLVKGLDDVLARATLPDPRGRFESAEAFLRGVLPWLDVEPVSGRHSQRSTSILSASSSARLRSRAPRQWQWAKRRPPEHETVIVAVGWDSDGHCLAPTTRGLSYWDGESFSELTPPPVHPIHALTRIGPGEWLLSTEGGRLVAYSADDARDVLRCPDSTLGIHAIDGRPDDLLVAVASGHARCPVLFACVGRHWLKPLPIESAISISGLARIEPEAWLVCGRKREGGGFAAIYRPLEWRLDVVASVKAGALVAAASEPELRLGVAVGGSEIVAIHEGSASSIDLGGEIMLSACDVDVVGGLWLAGTGRIWFSHGVRQPFEHVFHDSAFQAPFVSLYADVGRLSAVSADGSVLEANAPGV